MERRGSLTHLIFAVCDHFEPQHGVDDPAIAEQRIRAWHSGFQELQDDCSKAFGLRPLHTWFYPPHHGEIHLTPLARMAFDGLGEIELHYHHNGDNRESLKASLKKTLETYHQYGLLLQVGEPPGSKFGFIHGDWALDNSAGGRFCGVNGELSVLESLGCWADLTMPSANECQTRKINSIYYAKDSHTRAKSHDWGTDARVGDVSQEGLMLIQGPISLGLRGGLRPTMENAALTTANWGDAHRIRSWIRCGVHVRGRPDWIFIKLHAHGALERDFDALFGDRARAMHRILAERYNDGKRFKLHYVSARQAFNLVRAAEHGIEADPDDLLDWEIPPPVTSRYCLNARHEISACTSETLSIRVLNPSSQVSLELRHSALKNITGAFKMVDLSQNKARLHMPSGMRESKIRVRMHPNIGAKIISGSIIDRRDDELTLSANVDGQLVCEFEADLIGQTSLVLK